MIRGEDHHEVTNIMHQDGSDLHRRANSSSFAIALLNSTTSGLITHPHVLDQHIGDLH